MFGRVCQVAALEAKSVICEILLVLTVVTHACNIRPYTCDSVSEFNTKLRSTEFHRCYRLVGRAVSQPIIFARVPTNE